MVPTTIIVGGLPGTGKTTLARALSDQLDVTAFSKDELEAAVVRGMPSSPNELGATGYQLLLTLAVSELDHGRSVILDCVAHHTRVHEHWGTLLERRVHYIECICSDSSLHRQRIQTRDRQIEGWYELTWDQVEDIRQQYRPFQIDRLVLDSADSLDENLQKAVQYLTT